MKSVYAEFAQVKAAREEFMLLFGTKQTTQLEQNELQVKLNERIVLNPIAAKRLAIQLEIGIRDYESRFGSLDRKTEIRTILKPTPPLHPPLPSPPPLTPHARVPRSLCARTLRSFSPLCVLRASVVSLPHQHRARDPP